MMNLNGRVASLIKPLANLAPASITVATHFTAFVDAKDYLKLFLVIQTGTQAGCDVEMRQSDASAGTNPVALALADGAKVTIADADDNKVIVIDIAPNASRYVDVTLTPAAAGVIGATLFGIPRNETAPTPST